MLVAVALGAFAGLHSRLFLVRQLHITGLVQLSAQQVARAADIPAGAYLWQVRPWNVARRIELLPLVRSAQVRLLWPDRVAVAIAERRPVFLVADGSQRIEVDRRAMAIATEPATRVPPGLPVVVVSGFSPAGIKPGDALPITAGRRAVEVALGLGAQGRSLVATIGVDAQGQVTLHLRDGLTVLYGDGSQARRKTEELLGMLQVIASRHLSVSVVDLSSASTPTLKLVPAKPAK